MRQIRPKISTKTIKSLAPQGSIASKVLRGITIRGKVIKTVRKGREPWRYLIFKDNTYLPIKREPLFALVSDTCVKKCVEIFHKQNEAGKQYIALRCLLYRKKHASFMAPGAEFQASYKDENRIRELIKEIDVREIKKLKTPSCKLCNLHFVYYFRHKSFKLDLKI
jgi:hypothetical protein